MKTDGAHSGIEPETWALFRLLERVIVIAVRDARKGDIGAVAFLDLIAPSWRKGKLLKNAEKIK